MSSKKAQGPLLYIHQPFTRRPVNVNMQDVFIKKRKDDPKPIVQEIIEEELEDTREGTKPINRIVTKETETQNRTEKNVNANKSNGLFHKVKPFKEMSLIERLEYLHNFPKVLPPVACVFSTEKENFQGFLISYENEEVTIQLPNQTTKTLTVAQLANISMMGIRKE